MDGAILRLIMASERQEPGYIGPDRWVNSLVLSAVRQTYDNLDERERNLLDRTVRYVQSKKIKNFGRTSILEFLAKLDMMAQHLAIPSREDDLKRLAQKEE